MLSTSYTGRRLQWKSGYRQALFFKSQPHNIMAINLCSLVNCQGIWPLSHSLNLLPWSQKYICTKRTNNQLPQWHFHSNIMSQHSKPFEENMEPRCSSKITLQNKKQVPGGSWGQRTVFRVLPKRSGRFQCKLLLQHFTRHFNNLFSLNHLSFWFK